MAKTRNQWSSWRQQSEEWTRWAAHVGTNTVSPVPVSGTSSAPKPTLESGEYLSEGCTNQS